MADTTSGSRARLARTLIELGANAHRIKLASSFEEAELEIKRHRPHLIICDFKLGEKKGLDLLPTYREELKNPELSMFILVTSESSQSAVAQAAEEEIDTYILKPYSKEKMQKAIIEAAMVKLHPSEYFQLICQGKELLKNGKTTKAFSLFDEAIEKETKPTLAHYHKGRAFLKHSSFDAAVEQFKKGLLYNEKHYNCMVGLYDAYTKKNEHQAAYEVVRKISKIFPSNPKRFASIVRLAVMTKNYRDLEDYYQLFTYMDNWEGRSLKHICAGMLVCGKYYLRQNDVTAAVRSFKRAALTSNGRIGIYREIIEELVATKQGEEAKIFLKRFPLKDHDNTAYLAMKFLIADQFVPPGVIIDAGKKLISKGVHDPSVYKIVIERAREAGLKDLGEAIAYKAVDLWPEKKDEYFEKYIS